MNNELPLFSLGASNENEGYLIGSRSRDSYKDRLLKFCIENPFYKRICSMTPVSLPPMYDGEFIGYHLAILNIGS